MRQEVSLLNFRRFDRISRGFPPCAGGDGLNDDDPIRCGGFGRADAA